MTRIILTIFIGALLATPFGVSAYADTLDKVQAATQSASRAGAAAQARINDIDDKTQALLYEYRSRLRTLEALETYNDQLETLIKAQEQDVGDMRSQIDGVVHIDRALMPLMARMIEALEQFIILDIPFLKQERRARITHLRTLMDRADISVAEKYRKIIEAYEIENEYGRTLEVYDGVLDIEGAPHHVQFLRIGRVAWIYQTADRQATGIWVAASKSFMAWDEDLSALAQAYRVAANQAAPDFLIVPLSIKPSVKPKQKASAE